MALDPELVRDAEAARERLLAAQHAAERARADYHHAIRRLYAAGGSLREIAEALRLSHQRVHQIIDQVPEPARRRRRQGRRPPGPAGPCSFCGRSRKEGARLIAGPGVCICDRCVARATRLSAGAVHPDWAEAPMALEASGSEARCSFCGKNARQVPFLVASGLTGAPGGKLGQDGARICDECLDLCLNILAEPSEG
jgi:ClpX C4-type zinc finger